MERNISSKNHQISSVKHGNRMFVFYKGHRRIGSKGNPPGSTAEPLGGDLTVLAPPAQSGVDGQ